METQYNTNDQLLADAAAYAAVGDTAEMERMLLGVLASGDNDDRHHDRMEEIQSTGYAKAVLRYMDNINSGRYLNGVHTEVYSLLHAASMTSLESFRQALEFVKGLENPEAQKALRDFYPSIDDEKLSMFEHDKIRNVRNANYFHEIQETMREMAPELVQEYRKHF